MNEQLPHKRSQNTTRTKRRSPSVPPTRIRGLWPRHWPEAAADLHDYVLVKHFGGDRERLSTGSGLFRRSVADDTFKWFVNKYPQIPKWYEETYHRPLNAGHVVRRVRFQYVQYSADGVYKQDGKRSREYRGVIR